MVGGGWWLVVGSWWLVVVVLWLVLGSWWLVVVVGWLVVGWLVDCWLVVGCWLFVGWAGGREEERGADTALKTITPHVRINEKCSDSVH